MLSFKGVNSFLPDLVTELLSGTKCAILTLSKVFTDNKDVTVNFLNLIYNKSLFIFCSLNENKTKGH